MGKPTKHTRKRQASDLTTAITKLIDRKIQAAAAQDDYDGVADLAVFHAQEELETALLKFFGEPD